MCVKYWKSMENRLDDFIFKFFSLVQRCFRKGAGGTLRGRASRGADEARDWHAEGRDWRGEACD